MLETDNYMAFALEWLVKSTDSILSHWNDNNKSFDRNSSDNEYFYPTATFHAISALSSCGLSFKNPKPSHFKINTKIPSFENLFNFILELNEDKIIEGIINKSSHIKKDNKNLYEEFKSHINKSHGHLSVEKVDEILIESKKIIKEITKKSKKDKDVNSESRLLIVYERFLACIDMSFININNEILNKVLIESKDIIDEFIGNESFEKLLPEPGLSPVPILNLVLCMNYYNSIYEKFNSRKCTNFDKSLDRIQKTILNHINFHMARYDDIEETSYDPISLSAALYCMTLLNPKFRNSSFFRSCLKVIFKSQYSNGCWPSGVSISFSSNGDLVQLPSVEIAVFMVDAAIDESFLLNHNGEILETLNILLPGLRKFAKYLESSFQSVNSKYQGWSSDRIGIKDYTETWITSLANRFLFKYWIAEKALLRYNALNKLGLKNYKSNEFTITQSKNKWDKEIVDPDDIITPTVKIFNDYITPILNQKKNNTYLFYPEKNKSSFILFGPPGSGKTFFVENLAKSLDWPLVELSPGNFVKNGLELIESTTKEIFDVLNSINHAVVFFDECDELFKTRDGEDKNAPRTILSFATASMLPKLQKLHDNHQVIFILGTNYLQRIDDAVKRKGRFDDIYLFDRPDTSARKRVILKKIEKDKKNETKFNIKKNKEEIDSLIESTNFYTFKELMQCLESFKTLENDSVDEYKKWCKSTGIQELHSAYGEDHDFTTRTIKKWKKKK